MANDLSGAISQYLNKGFGSMNKNDFEVFIFDWLIEHNFSNQNDYQLSIALRLPISKIKRLRYESSLRYPKQIDYKYLFVLAMKGARYEKDHIVFSIENISMRQYLRNLLMQRGNFYDSSFNSDIVKVSEKDFLCLLEDICLGDSEKKAITTTINKNSDKDVPHMIVKAVAAIAKSIGGESLQELTDVGLSKLLPILESLFSNK